VPQPVLSPGTPSNSSILSRAAKVRAIRPPHMPASPRSAVRARVRFVLRDLSRLQTQMPRLRALNPGETRRSPHARRAGSSNEQLTKLTFT
jgi:hypothetical protein